MLTKTLKLLAIGLLSGLSAAGCLQKDVAQTWYLETDGQVHWVLQEIDVRSDSQAALDRQREEDDYIAAVKTQNHETARGFRELGLTDIRTRLLRSSAPFVVITDAKAGRLDALGRRLLDGLRLEGTSVLERHGEGWHWVMTVRDPHASTTPSPSDELIALMNGTDRLRVVLATGRFDDASGFDLSSDQRVATLGDLEKQTSNGQRDGSTVVLRLRWR